MAFSIFRNYIIKRSRVTTKIEVFNLICQFSCRRYFCKKIFCIIFNYQINYVEYSRAGKYYINIFWSKLNKIYNNIFKQLKRVLNDFKKMQTKIIRFRRIFKRTQRRAQNKIIYFTKKFSKKINKRII